MDEKRCLNCDAILKGRRDRKFCSSYCKNAFHYKNNIKNESSLYLTIDKILKKNRKILKQYNKAGKSIALKNSLIEEGFNPKYFTHFWKGKNGNLYLFCYEYGFMEKQEKGKLKYILVTWQKYMN